MKKNNALHKLTLQGLLKILNININKLNNVLKSPYHRQYIIKNGKRRLIEIPNTELKALLQILCEYLQEIPPNFLLFNNTLSTDALPNSLVRKKLT